MSSQFSKVSLKLLSFSQIAVGIVLAVASWILVVGFGSGASNVIESLSAALKDSARQPELVAESIADVQQVLKEFDGAVVSYKTTVGVIQSSTSNIIERVQQQQQLVGKYGQRINEWAAIADSASSLLSFEVPTSIGWDYTTVMGVSVPVKPKMVWSKPLEALAIPCKNHASTLHDTAQEVADIAKTIGKETPRIQVALSSSFDQTIKALESSHQSIVSIQATRLKPSVEQLKKTSASLDQASAQLLGLKRIVTVSGAAMFAVSLFMILNGLVLWIIRPAVSPSS